MDVVDVREVDIPDIQFVNFEVIVDLFLLDLDFVSSEDIWSFFSYAWYFDLI